MAEFQVSALLKEDQLGRVERLDRFELLHLLEELERAEDEEVLRRAAPADSTTRHAEAPRSSVPAERASAVRRVACGGRIPFSGFVARRLLERERRALLALDGLTGVPALVPDPEARRAVSLDGRVPRERDVLVRSWMDGAPLHLAESLPEDFFDHLDRLVAELHARGVCHNDLHKEQNIVVGRDGRPCLVDFQLASCHGSRGALFASRARDDLRHVEKHRRRYTRWGRGPHGAHEPTAGAGADLRRSWIARVWRRTGKPVYVLITRGVLRTRDGEARRPSSGPWPRWTAPLGPRAD